MKKILAFMLAALMLAGCASGAEDGESSDGGSEPKKEINIMDNMTVDEFCPSESSETRSDVEYPSYEHVTYHSETTGSDRGFNILLPAGYKKSKKYPVVYVLHGIFGDENTMTNEPAYKFKEISTNLAADGKAKEAILVFPAMYATGDPNMQPGFTPEQVLPYDNFINDLVNDLMPYVEDHYSVLTGRDNTAICGFSMGGRETLFIGLERPDLFGYVGAFAPAPGLTPGQDWAMQHPGQLTEDELTFEGKDYSPYLLLVCCGTDDHTVGTFPKSYHEIFDRNGVKHIWYEVTGADHDATMINSGFNNFMSNIFPD